MASSENGAVLFDLDGVLVDSRGPITACINHALVAHGLAVRPREALVKFIGPPLASAFAELTGEPPDSPLVASCVGAYRTRYADVSLRETTVVPGIARVLTELGRRYRLAVATSKPVAFAEPLLDAVGLRPFFAFCAGPELSASGEDKGITIASALVRLGGGDAVMIGDRGLDIVGARACSIPAIGVTWGAGSVEELGSVNPDAIVDVPAQLPGAIAAIIASSSPSAPGPAQATARGPAQADR